MPRLFHFVFAVLLWMDVLLYDYRGPAEPLDAKWVSAGELAGGIESSDASSASAGAPKPRGTSALTI